MIICYTVPEIWHMTDVSIIFHFHFSSFALLLPQQPKKWKFQKKWKKHLEISSFYTSVPKIMIICYTVPEIWRMTDITVVFHFGIYFALTAQKFKISKKWKKCLEISSFHTCVPKIMIGWCTVPEIWCAMDQHMYGQKKWHRGGCPN